MRPFDFSRPAGFKTAEIEGETTWRYAAPLVELWVTYAKGGGIAALEVKVSCETVGGRGQASLATRVNGELRQDDTTDRLTWGFAWLINYISTFTTLRPGDLIWTGTPTGAGGHQTPPNWLKPGDVVEVEVPQIGVLRNTVIDER